MLLDVRGDVPRDVRGTVLCLLEQSSPPLPPGYRPIFPDILVPPSSMPFCLPTAKCAWWVISMEQPQSHHPVQPEQTGINLASKLNLVTSFPHWPLIGLSFSSSSSVLRRPELPEIQSWTHEQDPLYLDWTPWYYLWIKCLWKYACAFGDWWNIQYFWNQISRVIPEQEAGNPKMNCCELF